MTVYIRAVEPIGRHEFAGMLKRATPPTGWGQTIAVANSGGPDSTCLLFLLHQYFKSESPNGLDAPTPTPSPTRLVSLTVDHGLQASSSTMASQTADVARSIGVEHSTLPIPWGQGAFPPLPTPGSAFEEMARRARYRLLFDEMTRVRAGALAAGHHLDDQVETALMRLRLKSTVLGASGMRHCRRWGMGGVPVGGLDWAGYEGMKRWIVRPFLGVGKDRILATCEANKLDYVTDKTNFQPELTLRNAIRHVVNHGMESSKGLPPELREQVEDVNKALEKHPSFDGNLDSGLDKLRSFVLQMADEVVEVEKEVDQIIKTSRVPSPEGTFLLYKHALQSLEGKPLLQMALILRILRYVSPKPWGSLQAQAGRRSSRLTELASRLMQPYNGSRAGFTAGAQVLWKPFISKPKRILRGASRPPEFEGYIACRQPPDNQTLESTADRDLTRSLLDAFSLRKAGSHQRTLDVLFDCRFLVQMDLDAVSPFFVDALSVSGSKLVLKCEEKWFHPYLAVRTPKGETVLHEFSDPNVLRMGKKAKQAVDWISIKFVRAISNA